MILADTNAHFGETQTAAIGPHAPDSESAVSEVILRVLNKFSLAAPATFPGLHVGDNHTWVGPRARSSRIDFVFIPTDWLCSVTKFWVVYDLDNGAAHQDHFMPVVNLQLAVRAGRTTRLRRSAIVQPDILGEPAVMEYVSRALTQVAPPPWSMDAHRHAASLTEQFQHILFQVSAMNPKRSNIYTSKATLAVSRMRQQALHIAHTARRNFNRATHRAHLHSASLIKAEATPDEYIRVLESFDQSLKAMRSYSNTRVAALDLVKSSAKSLRKYVKVDKRIFITKVLDGAAHCPSQLWQKLRPLRRVVKGRTLC